MLGIILGTLVLVAVVLVVFVFYLLSLRKALSRCRPENRAMPPGQVWLMLIPCFGYVWHFFVVINMAKSLESEFRQRNLPIESQPGRGLGIAMCVLNVISGIPYLGLLTALPAMVCWILYWVRIAGYSKRLEGPVS